MERIGFHQKRGVPDSGRDGLGLRSRDFRNRPALSDDVREAIVEPAENRGGPGEHRKRARNGLALIGGSGIRQQGYPGLFAAPRHAKAWFCCHFVPASEL